MSLASRPDLGRLKRFARALKTSATDGDAAALARLRVCFPDLAADSVKLSQAQLVIAREYGSSSWPDLVARVEKRLAKRKAAEQRREARRDDAYALAERWFALARAGDVEGLVRAFPVAKCRMIRARTVMQHDRVAYDAFLDVLVRGTTHPNPRIRFECAHGLDSFGNARCRDALVRLMDDPVPRVRWMAMHAISCHACNDATCVEDDAVHRRIAQSALTDESIEVRRHAAAALGMIGAPTGVLGALRTIIEKETDPRLLRAARFALARAAANAS